MSRRTNQTTEVLRCYVRQAHHEHLSTYVATIWSAIALFQCSDGRCMLVVKPSLCGLDCQPAAESVHDLHNGLEARVAVPVEALVKLSRPRPSPSRSAPYPSLWSYRRLRPAATPNRQARPPIKQQHERVALLRGANTVAGTEIEPQRAGPVTNRMQVTHRPPHLEAQSESRADSGFRVPVLYPAEPLAIFASHMYFHMTCCIPWDTICLA